MELILRRCDAHDIVVYKSQYTTIQCITAKVGFILLNQRRALFFWTAWNLRHQRAASQCPARLRKEGRSRSVAWACLDVSMNHQHNVQTGKWHPFSHHSPWLCLAIELMRILMWKTEYITGMFRVFVWLANSWCLKSTSSRINTVNR